ncbi:M56 family metallopeptidase [Polycladomyces subterraneus]|uniref:M56 family metallopeptidase n=1 Tax=Polycladomyces subterraneus TaxID=1016997 RepID=A0ABT8IKB4_9BACL|nr:M56 family metallopeptidase [Polycladomyces subterraneus]MDN4593217.1 M56 family metallopeptidase [Polycladomyces subterraneus]
MTKNAFTLLLHISAAIGTTLLTVWVLSTDAVIRTAIDWVHRCCGVIFSSGQIPGGYYLFTSLLVVWVFLFIWRVRSMVRQTQRFLATLLPLKVNHPIHPVLLRFQQKYGVLVDVFDYIRPLAFTYGWKRSRIGVSTGLIQLLNPQELEAVLEHEYHHCLARDPLKMVFATGAATAFFFLPVVFRLCQRYCLEKEIEADRRAAEKVGAKAVAAALYKMTAFSSGGLSVIPRFDQEGQNVLRVKALLSGKPDFPRISIADWMWSGISFLLLAAVIADLISTMSIVLYMHICLLLLTW